MAGESAPLPFYPYIHMTNKNKEIRYEKVVESEISIFLIIKVNIILFVGIALAIFLDVIKADFYGGVILGLVFASDIILIALYLLHRNVYWRRIK
jgi:hypothetical protein